jgi:uridine kinase
MKPYVIGVCGGSSTGKTRFIGRLRELFDESQLCVISQDEYYKERAEQQEDEQGVKNFDLPYAIDEQALETDLLALLNGETVQKKEYTYNNPDRVPKTLVFRPAPVLIVEGIYVFYFKNIDRLFDFRIFLHTQKKLKYQRRKERDNQERGYSLDHIVYTQEYHVEPSYRQYIRPFRHEADLIIPNNENGFDKALEVVGLLIKSKQPHGL